MAARKKSTQSKSFVGDSFQNFLSNIGLGTNTQLSAGIYTADYWTRNRQELEFAYRTAWLVAQAVDVPAEDMTRAGIEIKATMDPELTDKLDRALMRLDIWGQIANTIRWSRLFGGAIAVMMIDGQNVNTPLKPESIRPGQFKGLLVLDRWLLQPSFNDLITELGPDIGKPRFYSVIADAQYLKAQTIHHSRVLRLEGLELPYFQKQVEQTWGESVLERIHDRLVAFDSGTMGAAQLLFKAHIRTYKIADLRQIVAAGGNALKGLLEQIKMMRLMQGNEGITLLDATDEFEAFSYTFAGISDILLQLGQQLSGALQIPMVRLFGQSPAGLNSTGESDLRTYYDNIARQQESKLRLNMSRLLDVMIRSELGIEPPEDFHFIFKPLWQTSDTEKADVAQKNTTAIQGAFECGLVPRDIALKELRQLSGRSGMWTNIDDESIADAESEPPLSEINAQQMENEQQAANEKEKPV